MDFDSYVGLPEGRKIGISHHHSTTFTNFYGDLEALGIYIYTLW